MCLPAQLPRGEELGCDYIHFPTCDPGGEILEAPDDDRRSGPHGFRARRERDRLPLLLGGGFESQRFCRRSFVVDL